MRHRYLTSLVHKRWIHPMPSSSSTYVSDALVPWIDRLHASIAANRQVQGANFLQLATVDSQNKPHVRTVVFRGFHNSSSLIITADGRSSKVSQLQLTPSCEVVWWLPQNGEQYRLEGTIDIIDDTDPTKQDVRISAWQKLREEMRQQFFWPQPGATYTLNPVPVVTTCTPPSTFVLLLLNPSRVKYLRLYDSFSQVDEQDPMKTTWQLKRVH
ncbi:pyridoxamine 5-phosphate oxidase, FMN-binding [Thraustotheca clavata]|uniref:Pyridoxamine 5-phosphate oxidase, FMN-binding n=1 Tax=Thraustotheca clavata TaxID=74557 RepID=A0A1V9ZR65_9STRA|nr:pyridoxamine 5-phosphate oxidase, FMN-binding [Thraustotheca clavata]